MSRLVDIDEVIKVAENTFPQEDVRKITWVLCHTPTAYDVEKVVAELERTIKHVTIDGKDTGIEALYPIQTFNIVRKSGVE